MEAIDVHDLPEPVAAAIAAMVDALRTREGSRRTDTPHSSAAEDLGAVLDELFALDDASPVSLPENFGRADIYCDHD